MESNVKDCVNVVPGATDEQVSVTVNVTSSVGIKSEQNGASEAGPCQTTLGPELDVAVPNA